MATLLVIALAAAATLAIRKLLARRAERQAEAATIAATDGMSGTAFEHWTANLLRRSGCGKVEVRGGSGDLGADITARLPDGRKLIVQCKRWAKPVGSGEVQKVAGTARAVHGADVAVIVTTSRFTAGGIDLASRVGIDLIDRSALATWAASGMLPHYLAAAKSPR
ncbi:restriction endonuclease [Longispora albida]|uniref:restriction endonuclease n=1 Tax=Longispora albida TaxID=203523 RepID=UPI00037242FF|nr:restriction endonuclease [Longispora albida]